MRGFTRLLQSSGGGGGTAAVSPYVSIPMMADNTRGQKLYDVDVDEYVYDYTEAYVPFYYNVFRLDISDSIPYFQKLTQGDRGARLYWQAIYGDTATVVGGFALDQNSPALYDITITVDRIQYRKLANLTVVSEPFEGEADAGLYHRGLYINGPSGPDPIRGISNYLFRSGSSQTVNLPVAAVTQPTTVSVSGYAGGLSEIIWTGSTGNDGTYTVASSTYDRSLDVTTITTVESIPSAVADGSIVIQTSGIFAQNDINLHYPINGEIFNYRIDLERSPDGYQALYTKIFTKGTAGGRIPLWLAPFGNLDLFPRGGLGVWERDATLRICVKGFDDKWYKASFESIGTRTDDVLDPYGHYFLETGNLENPSDGWRVWSRNTYEQVTNIYQLIEGETGEITNPAGSDPDNWPYPPY